MRVRCSTMYVLCLSLTVLSLTACEDEAARQRRELQEVVSGATQTLREATLVVVDPGNADQFTRTRDQLAQVVSRLRSADTSGETGQEVAINLLLADAGQKLAAMHLAELERAGAMMRDDSSIARSHINSMLRLSDFIAATSALDISDETAELDSARTGATAQLSTISDMLAQLDGPIAQLTAQNREDVEQINMLRREAEELVQRAGELGPAEGFPQYEQALQMQREAGVIETRIAHRELDLAYQYEPQAERADSQALQLQQYIAALDQARQNLAAILDSVSSEVSKTNQRLSALRSELETRLSSIEATISGPIETALQDGLSTAEHALQAVRKAGRTGGLGGHGNSARMLEAQLLETQGRLHWASARAMTERINVLERVVAAGDVAGNAARYSSQLSDAESDFEAAINAARESYIAARAALPSGNVPGIDSLHRSLDLAIAAMSGRSADDTGDPTTPGAGPASTDEGENDGGFPTPEALLAELQRIDPARPETSLVFINAVHTTTPLQSQFVNAVYESNTASTRLLNAVSNRIGPQAAVEYNAFFAANAPVYSAATLVDQSTESATIEMQASAAMGGQIQSIELLLVDGSWMVSFDSLMQQFAMPGMSISDSIQAIASLTHIADDLAEQIENGAITSLDQLMTAMRAAAMDAANSP